MSICLRELTDAEKAAERLAAASVAACRVDELLADSKFLRGEALVELVRGITWAATPHPGER